VNQARSSGEMLEGWQPRFTIADRDAKIKGLEVALNELRAYLANESGEVYIYPDHKLADRDSTIKGLRAELEAQRAHYQGELEKARKAVDALASEYIREHKRRIEVEETISKLQETIEMYQKGSGKVQ
jgi:chromosome segregation ATPase